MTFSEFYEKWEQYQKIKTQGICFPGNSLSVQGLGLGTFTAGAQVQPLVWELKDHASCMVQQQQQQVCASHKYSF